MNYSNYALNSPVYDSVEGAPGTTLLIHTLYVCPQGCPALHLMFSLLRDLEQGIKKKRVRNADMMLLQHRNYFLGDLVYDMAERSERLAKCLKCKIFMFW